jgi:two-component system OmpR family sensor kinase
MALFYYFVVVSGYQNIFVLVMMFFSISLLLGLFLAKISIEPLKEYINALKALSKETLHELNLPISTIKMNTSMLKKSLDDEKSIKRVSRIDQACDMLQQRYNELDYMIKRQTKSVHVESFSLNELLKSRVEFLSNIYPNVEFVLNDYDFEVKIDKIGFQKVIDNILQNAIKYSSTSSRVSLHVKPYSLEIKDEGIGMDEFEVLKIFDKYYQSSDIMGGYGIGLSMVKRYCDEQKIAIFVDSKKDIGTKFLLDLKECVDAK